jgi:hypothetical protein
LSGLAATERHAWRAALDRRALFAMRDRKNDRGSRADIRSARDDASQRGMSVEKP